MTGISDGQWNAVNAVNAGNAGSAGNVLVGAFGAMGKYLSRRGGSDFIPKG